MKKILVIDDQDNLRDEIRDWFIFEGFDTYAAGSGREGVELAKKKLPDLILCDVMMPGMDGYQVLELLRNNPATRTIPFIFITALSERKNIRTGMDQGADDYITKPFTREELLKAVNTRMAKTSALDEQSKQDMAELRSNIASHLPHELRTPLNGILGFGQVLRDMPGQFSTEELREIGNTIYTSAQRLYRLINNYQTYAKLEVTWNNRPVVKTPSDLSELCNEQTMEVAKRYNRIHDLVIHTEPARAMIREEHFRQLVDELVDNAFKFSEEGKSVVVIYRCEGRDVNLTVHDQGRGIKEDDIRKIGAWMQFERMQHEQQGSGFGLILARKLAEFYEGSLDIESIYGKGTFIRVTIPGAVNGEDS